MPRKPEPQQLQAAPRSASRACKHTPAHPQSKSKRPRRVRPSSQGATSTQVPYQAQPSLPYFRCEHADAHGARVSRAASLIMPQPVRDILPRRTQDHFNMHAHTRTTTARYVHGTNTHAPTHTRRARTHEMLAHTQPTLTEARLVKDIRLLWQAVPCTSCECAQVRRVEGRRQVGAKQLVRTRRID